LTKKNKKIILIFLISLFIILSGVSYILFSIRKSERNNISLQALNSSEIGKTKVPDLVGQDFETSMSKVSDYELVMISEEFDDSVPKGIIISQTPTGGSLVLPRFTIAAKVSKGSENKILPDITGKTLVEAALELTSLSLVPIEIRQVDEIPEGIVIGYRNHKAGDIIKHGEKVAILVSSG
jgi:serine/threonine-protein kinase